MNPARIPALPIDAIESTSVRIRYGLNLKSFETVTAGLRRWRLGTGMYFSEREIRASIKRLARFEPAPETGQEATA